jgi:hypothetical protein
MKTAVASFSMNLLCLDFFFDLPFGRQKAKQTTQQLCLPARGAAV